MKIVYDRYKEGKQVVKELIEYIKERVSAEETYAKALSKMAKAIPNRENEKSYVQVLSILTGHKNYNSMLGRS
jgi:hypothetical protein